VPYRSVNPAMGELLKSFPEHTDEEMWSAFAKADKDMEKNFPTLALKSL